MTWHSTEFGLIALSWSGKSREMVRGIDVDVLDADTLRKIWVSKCHQTFQVPKMEVLTYIPI